MDAPDRHSITVSRRALLMGSAATGIVVAAGGTSDAAIRNFRPRPGVNVHSTFLAPGNVYAEYDRVRRAIWQLNSARLRDKLSLRPGHPQQDFWRKTGVPLHLSLGNMDGPVDNTALKARLLEVAPLIRQFAGYNEPDKDRVPPSVYLPKVLAHQKALWRIIKGDSRLSHINVVAPVLRDANRHLPFALKRLYETIDGYYDFANLHVYPRAELFFEPEAYIDQRLSLLDRTEAKGKTTIFSESGWWTGIDAANNGTPVNKRQQRDLTVRLVNYAAKKGIRTFVYELMDDAGAADSQQGSYGCFHADFTPKLIVRALAAI